MRELIGKCTISVKDSAGNVIERNAVTLNCLPAIFANLVLWTLIFAGTVAVILIIIGGIKFITSGGDPKQAEGARKTITWAIIGLVLILLSFAIIRFIGSLTGVACINYVGFTNCLSNTPPGPRECPADKNCGQRWYCDSNDNTCKLR